jgi:hypothetical protein
MQKFFARGSPVASSHPERKDATICESRSLDLGNGCGMAAAKRRFVTKQCGNQNDKTTSKMRSKALTFLFWAFAGLMIFTMVVILLQGFHPCGFNLDPRFLYSLDRYDR